LRSIADLYGLGVTELAEYDRMGETLARKILRNLAAKDEVSLARFVAGFDIEGIGELIVEKPVQSGFDSLDKLRAAKAEDLAQVDGLAEITARAIVDGLAALGPEMDALLATGAVRIAAAAASGPLAGKSFCFTGELKSMKRADAQALVRSLGGSIRESVTKGLSYLVTNDPSSGSAKSRKAASYGTAVIDEDEFLGLAGRR
jgi:DNA ligase (NAD+)